VFIPNGTLYDQDLARGHLHPAQCVHVAAEDSPAEGGANGLREAREERHRHKEGGGEVGVLVAAEDSPADAVCRMVLVL
jgi:hypothetical protein